MVVQQPNLSPESTPWAREITQGQRDLKRELERSTSNNSNNNLQLTSSVNLLTEQVNDLVGRVSYAQSSGAITSWSTNAGLAAFGPAITFTITERRVVNITYTLRANLGGSVTSSGSSASAQVLTDISTPNGASLGRGYGFLSASTSFAGSGLDSVTSNATIMARALITLPAGTHTVQGTIDRGAGAFGSASASGSAYDPALFVDVLQLA